MNQWTANRRGFLRGLGAMVAIPALESLATKTAFASADAATLACTPTGAPLRAAFMYFPNGAIPAAWWPEKDGDSFKLGPTLASLEPLRNSVQVLKGIDNMCAEPGNDGGGDHARGNSTFLTGVRIKKSAVDIHAGISIDQAIANKVGAATRFPSLQLASDPVRQTSGCDSGYSCAYQYNISWKSETTPMSTENNPRQVFERLFGDGAPSERANNLRRRREERKSILDFVLDDARSMDRKLQQNDRRKLDEYLTGVRELESRIQRAEVFGDPPNPARECPLGIPESHEEYVQLMYELSALAFQTDSTRVLTLLLGHDGDNRGYDFIGVSEGHHDLTHHQNKADRIAKVQQIDAWYVQQFAKFLERLNGIQDLDGNSLLHNSMIVFGSGNADGNRHTHNDVPLLLAGSAGGAFTPGRCVDHEAKPLTNLYLTMAKLMGAPDLVRFGDSTGELGNV